MTVAPLPQHAAPFRLLVHIGAGKTGTSSIQRTLRSAQIELRRFRTLYLGRMLELASTQLYDWQFASAPAQFRALDRATAIEQLLDVLRPTIKTAAADGYGQAIWSNESFFRRHHLIAPALSALAAEGVDIRIVAYVRRHDAWARSAYVQWGIKHKTYRGDVVPFEEYRTKKGEDFATVLKPWLESFGDNVIVRNFDAADDVVADFLSVANIEPGAIEHERRNEMGTPEELVFRALFNDQFEEKVKGITFNRVLKTNKLRFDVDLESWLAQLMPDGEALKAVAVDAADDRETLNKILVANGQAPIDTSPLRDRPVTVDHGKVLATVCQIVVNQAVRIGKLEEQLGAGQREGPVPSRGGEAAEAVTKARVPAEDGQSEKAESVTGAKNGAGKPVSPPGLAPASDQLARGAPQARSVATCSDEPVFVLSTGRSGSTLIQRVLNCHPDLVVWGEHYGFLDGLARAYSEMIDGRLQYPQTEQDNRGPALLLPTLRDPTVQLEWVNPWSLEEFKPQVRRFIEGYFAARLAPEQRWGFKEIRYNQLPVLRMLSELYPKGRFVFVKRDPVDVACSKVFSFIKEARWSTFSTPEKNQRVRRLLSDIQEHYGVYDSFMNSNPGLGIVVEFEKLVAEPDSMIERMLRHLKLDPDRFDWSLGNQVMSKVLSKTRQNDETVRFVRDIAAQLQGREMARA